MRRFPSLKQEVAEPAKPACRKNLNRLGFTQLCVMSVNHNLLSQLNQISDGLSTTNQ